MSIYNEHDAVYYDQVLNQIVYRYYVNKKLQSIVNWVSKKSVLLDVGCGTGIYTTSLAKQCRAIVGMDISPKMVERAICRTNQISLSNVHYVVGDVAHFPFRDKAFDLVFSVNLFHHVVDKNTIKKGFLEQVQSVSPGGHILVFELNPNSLGWSKDLIPKIIRGFVYLLLFPLHQKVIDNVEEDTRMLSIAELTDGIKKINVVSKKVGGFIPTYCPKFLFKIFVILEKIMETMPLLKRYGAHVLIVGENN